MSQSEHPNIQKSLPAPRFLHYPWHHSCLIQRDFQVYFLQLRGNASGGLDEKLFLDTTLPFHASVFVRFVRFLPECFLIHPDWFANQIAEIHPSQSDYRSFLLICNCLLYTSPSPRDRQKSRMPSSA